MGMFSEAVPPSLPLANDEYNRRDMDLLLNILRLYFNRLNAEQQLNVATLNINLNTLPTEADLADLREGDIYRDTTASNVIKVKT
jgi:hypothetical protein